MKFQTPRKPALFAALAALVVLSLLVAFLSQVTVTPELGYAGLFRRVLWIGCVPQLILLGFISVTGTRRYVLAGVAVSIYPWMLMAELYLRAIHEQ